MVENPQNVFIPTYTRVEYQITAFRNGEYVNITHTRMIPSRPAPPEPEV